MPLEASKTGMPIIDIKALPVDPTGPSRWGDGEGGTVKRGVERTALQPGSKPPQEWAEVYDSIATVGEIRVYWRADFQSGSRVLKKVF